MRCLPTLVEAARSGDTRAYGEIVNSFQDMAFASCLARIGDVQLAQDAAQEAFLDAWLNLDQLREPIAFPAWFRRVLVKHADRQIRRRQPALISPDSLEGLAGDGDEPDASVEADDRTRRVRDAVASLPESLRDVTILYYLEGYSQKEIAAFLAVSAGAVKKRLFLARRRLKERGSRMVKEALQTAKPSASDDFAVQIRFFVALRAGNLSEIKALALQHPELVSVRTIWGIGSDGYYWPLDATPLFWAVATDDEPLFTFLCSQGAEVSDADRHGLTPLHTAVQLRRPAMVRLLLQRNASIDATSARGQTPLMLAVLRGSPEMVGTLLKAGADASLTDEGGRTAADWARIRDLPDITCQLHAQGVQASGIPGPSAVPRTGNSQVLESGIKIVDLFVPVPPGGHVGLFSPLAGIGVSVLVGQLAHNFVDIHDGHVIFSGQEIGARTSESMKLLWRSELGFPDRMLEDRLALHFAPEGADRTFRRRTVESALTAALDLEARGHQVLHIVESPFAADDAVPVLRPDPAEARAGITTLWLGAHTAGLEPEPFGFLDGVITFSRERACQRLLPAVDPLRSWSRLLREAPPDDQHAGIAAEARRHLMRYDDLHVQYEYRGFDSLFYLEDLDADRSIVARARRLTRFLTQPFVGVEPYTGRPGVRVSLSDTLRGCRSILEGEADQIAEEYFEYVGALNEVVERSAE